MDNVFGAIEFAEQDQNSKDIVLCGIDKLSSISEMYKKYIDNNLINSGNTFSNFFGLNEKEKFYYTLYSFNNGEICWFENGVGYCYEKDGKTYLKRYKPVNNGKKVGYSIACRPNAPYYFAGPTIAISSIPQSFTDMICCENNVLTSRHCNTPICVEIENNSVLGRLDKNVGSISFSSIFNNIKDISLNSLNLIPGKVKKAKKGTLIYDKEDDVIKYYTGTTWRTLAWVEDEKQE